MNRRDKGKEELIKEIEELNARLREAEETLRAIRSGEVDALLVYTEDGERVFTLQGAEQPYRIMIETMNEGAVTLMHDGTVLYCNLRFASLLKVSLENIMGFPLVRFVIPDDVKIFEALLEWGSEGSSKGEVTFQCNDGTLVPVQLSMSALRVNAELCAVCAVVTDLTEQKRNEEIIVAEQLARSILDQIAEAVVVCDIEGRIIRASQTANLLCGRNSLFQPFEKVFPLQSAEGGHKGEDFSLAAVLRGKVFRQVEANLVNRPSANSDVVSVINLLVSGSPLRDAQNKTIGCVFSLTDITQRKRIEEQVKAALKEKELHLQEVHHRVKNNLQIVSSLLNLQSRSIIDGQAREKFKESQDRIKSMALIHEKFYQSENLIGVNFGEYITSLTNHLLYSYAIGSRVKLIIDLENLLVNIDKAIPCGLIVNEIVSNSLKYAFSDGRRGEIRIAFKLDTDGYNLIVSNNGIPFPEDLDFRSTKSLGLQLVCALVDQLRGTIELDRSNGAKFRITLPA